MIAAGRSPDQGHRMVGEGAALRPGDPQAVEGIAVTRRQATDRRGPPGGDLEDLEARGLEPLGQVFGD